MNIFLTGYESFIGRVVRRQCDALGWSVTGVDLADTVGRGGVRGDIRSRELADWIPDGTDAIVHLAAVSRDSDCQADVGRSYDINVVGTARVAEAARTRNVERVVFASSEWVYGETRNGDVQRESQSIDVASLQSEYALSKATGEQVLRIAHQKNWFDVLTMLRFGIVYGPRAGNWSAVESIFHQACCRREVRIGSRRSARRFIQVEDVAGGILASCQGDSAVYNLSGSRLLSLGEIIDTSFGVLGFDVPVVETSPESISIRNPSSELIATELNWKPQMELVDGLRGLYKFFESEQLIQCTA